MYDNYNRQIDYLRLSVTDNCNLNCFYCKPHHKQRVTEMSDDKILSIVHAAVKKGIKKIRVTGGEPLVRKGIYQLLRKIKDVKGVEELTLTTNGTLLFDNVSLLKTSGVDRVNISIDSLHNDDYNSITKSNLNVDFHKLIQDLQEHEITPIKVNVVLLKGVNEYQINEYIDLADRYDIQIRFIELMDIGEMDYDYDSYFIQASDVVKEVAGLINKKVEGNTTYYNIKNKKGRIGFINPISNKFCGSCNRIRVTSDGKLRPCLHSNKEINIIDLSDEGIEQSLVEAIESKPKEHELDKKHGTRSIKTMNKIGG